MSQSSKYMESAYEASEDSTIANSRHMCLDTSLRRRLPRMSSILKRRSSSRASPNLPSISKTPVPSFSSKPPLVPPLKTKHLYQKREKTHKILLDTNQDYYTYQQFKRSQILGSKKLHSAQFEFWFLDWTDELDSRRNSGYFSIQQISGKKFQLSEFQNWLFSLQQEISEYQVWFNNLNPKKKKAVKMDLKFKQERIRTMLRLVGDEVSGQYSRCLEQISRCVVQMMDDQEIDLNHSEGFLRKDKIAHSPLQNQANGLEILFPLEKKDCQSVLLGCKEQNGVQNRNVIRNFQFDYVFSQQDTSSALIQALSLDLSQHNCVVSVGRSETLSSPNGLINHSINKALAENYEIKVKCVSISGNKVTVLHELQQISCREEVQTIFNIDYFNSRKPKDSAVVTTLILENQDKKYIQFVDVSQFSSSVELFGKVLTNQVQTNEELAINKDKFIQVVSKSISFGGLVTIIGNIKPILPHRQSVIQILLFLNNIYLHRHKNSTLYTSLLHRQIERLEKSLYKQNQTQLVLNQQMVAAQQQMQIKLQKTLQEKLSLQKQNQTLQCLFNELNQKLQNENQQELRKIQVENKNLKEVIMVKEAENTQLIRKLQFSNLMIDTEKQKIRDFQTKYSSHFQIQSELRKTKQKLKELQIMNENLNKKPYFSQKLQEKSTQCQSFTSYIQKLQNELKLANQKIEILQRQRNKMCQYVLPEKSLKKIQYFQLLNSSWIFADKLYKQAIEMINQSHEINQIRFQNQQGKLFVLTARFDRIQCKYLKTYQELKEKSEKLQNLEIELKKINQQFTKYKQDEKTHFKQKKSQAKSQFNQIKSQNNQLSQTINNLHTQIQKLNQQLISTDKNLTQLKKKLNQQSKKFEKLKKQKHKQQNQSQVQISNLKRQLLQKKEEVQQLKTLRDHPRKRK